MATNKNIKQKYKERALSSAVLTARRNQNLYRQPTQVQLGPTSATFVVVALVGVLALLYLNQITKTGALNYQMSDLTSARDRVLEQKQDLSVEAARLQSIQATRNSAVATAMVPTSAVTYAK